MIEVKFDTWEDFDKSIGGLSTMIQMIGLQRLTEEANKYHEMKEEE